MFIDTHCHLDAAEFDPDRSAVLARAQAAGVARLVLPAVERANFDAVAELALKYPGCVAGYGIHPLYVETAEDADLAALEARLAAGAAFVGEIGLDGYIEGGVSARQEHWFEAQLKLARRYDLPVVLHLRRAQDRVLKYLRRHRVRGGYAHAFNGSLQQAHAFIELGFKLGFGGAMTYGGSLRIRELAASLPLESLVLETDAPDIAPAWLAGGRNEPAQLPACAAVMAQLRQMDVDTLAAATCANACAVIAQLADQRAEVA